MTTKRYVYLLSDFDGGITGVLVFASLIAAKAYLPHWTFRRKGDGRWIAGGGISETGEEEYAWLIERRIIMRHKEQ